MSNNSINIGWNKYEVVLLIDSYNQYVKGKTTRKDAIAILSRRLRLQMVKIGMSISDTYRNENGISLQMSAMEHILTNGEKGIGNHSRLFEEIAQVFKSDRSTFDRLLAIANGMYPYKGEEGTESPKDNYFKPTQTTSQPKYSGFLFEPPTKYVNKKYRHILEKYFQQGYRLESVIETKRFIKYYNQEYGVSLEMGMDDINADIMVCGIVHEKRVYLAELMLQETKKERLIHYISETFKNGRHYIFYKVLFSEFHDDFLDSKIFDDTMLRDYLDYINDGHWYFRTSFFTNIASAKPDILSEVIECVRNRGTVVSEDEVVNELSHLPEEEVKNAFAERGVGLINCGRKLRCHIDNFLVSDDELKKIKDIIRDAIEHYQYINMVELLNDLKKLVPSFIENNEHLGDIALRNILSTKLTNEFAFKGNLISDKYSTFNTEDAFIALAHREHFVLEDIITLAKECGALANIYISTLLQYSVRINENEFVSQKNVSFDVEKTDEALRKIITKEYIPIQEFEYFTILPNCGYPWNIFLLESYIYNHSNAFKLIHSKMFSTTMSLGSIVKKSAPIPDFDTMVAHSVIDNNIPLDGNSIINHMCDKKYIHRHSYKDIQKIISKVMQLKSK